jgi:Icc-related predicted phosphoesterase
MRIAAAADIHLRPERRESNVRAFSAVNDLAELLVIAGDFTNHGMQDEMLECLRVFEHIHVPIVAVMGNHDYESGHQDELAGMLRVAGVHLLDGQGIEIDGVGFGGTKGFCGGFAPHELMAFGEGAIKKFVEISEREAIKLDYALAQLHTPVKVAITHYSPIKETVIGEPEPIFPFLGSTRLERALDRHTPTLALHGHAHKGSFCAHTQGGTRVCNVAVHVLQRRGEPHPFVIFDL